MRRTHDDGPGGHPAYYRPKEPPQESISLTALARRILRAAAARTNQKRSDVMERLLRERGGALTADDFPASDEAVR